MKEKAHLYFVSYQYGDKEGMGFGRISYCTREPMDIDMLAEIEESIEETNLCPPAVILNYILIGMIDFDFENDARSSPYKQFFTNFKP